MNFSHEDIESLRCGHFLTSIGSLNQLNLSIDPDMLMEELEYYKQNFKVYNPKKEGYNRFGLSLTSLDGGYSGIPDLTSILDHNKQYNTKYDEGNFNVPTPFLENSKELQSLIGQFHSFICRSHILKLNRGGFFPPHRDSTYLTPRFFRLFVSLTNSYNYEFILDKKILHLEKGQMYYINTALEHSLFSYENDSHFIVFNVNVTNDSIKTLRGYLTSQ